MPCAANGLRLGCLEHFSLGAIVRKLLFWPYQIYAWLVYVPLVVVITLVSGWLVVLISWLVSPRFASRHIATWWARLLAYLLPMPVQVQGAEHVPTDRSCVVVSNHASQVDILALYGWLGMDLKWVMKKELRKIPAVGIGCEKAGHIFVDRSNPTAARRAVNDALERLTSGIGILFFAEGTRSRDGRLLPFKKGAFRIAASEQLPVLPITLLGTGEVLPAKSLRLFPGRVKVIIHPLIEPVADNRDAIRDLMIRTRNTIASALPPEKQGPNAATTT
jgi:1-acyl-sn-glycerol-3-phosphate acyltransferase